MRGERKLVGLRPGRNFLCLQNPAGPLHVGLEHADGLAFDQLAVGPPPVRALPGRYTLGDSVTQACQLRRIIPEQGRFQPETVVGFQRRSDAPSRRVV